MALPEFDAEMMRFMQTLQDEPDRGCVLVGAAFLDDVLKSLLELHFVNDRPVTAKLLRQDGVVGTFGARIELAYALGLVSSAVHDDLNIIRKIRNVCAHRHHPASFHTPEIRDRCEALGVYRMVWSFEEWPSYEARQQFVYSVCLLVVIIERWRGSQSRSRIRDDPDRRILSS